MNPNVRHEFSCVFETYVPIFQSMFLETDDLNQLLSFFGNYQCYEIHNIVAPLSSWTSLTACGLVWHFLFLALTLKRHFQSWESSIERSALRSLTAISPSMLACVFYNKLQLRLLYTKFKVLCVQVFCLYGYGFVHSYVSGKIKCASRVIFQIWIESMIFGFWD